MSEWLKPYICTQCGGKVNPVTMVCEMCGTHFKEQDNVLRIVAGRPGVHTLGTTLSIDKELVYLHPKEYSELVLKQMTKELAECIAPFIEVETEEDPEYFRQIVRGRIRVLDSAFRFV